MTQLLCCPGSHTTITIMSTEKTFSILVEEVNVRGTKKFMHLTKNKQASQCTHNCTILCTFYFVQISWHAARRCQVFSVIFFVIVIPLFIIIIHTKHLRIGFIQTGHHVCVAFAATLICGMSEIIASKRKIYSIKIWNENWSVINSTERCRMWFRVGDEMRWQITLYYYIYWRTNLKAQS